MPIEQKVTTTIPPELATLLDPLAEEIAHAVCNQSGIGYAYNLDYLHSHRGIVATFGYGGSNEFTTDTEGNEHLKPESASDFTEQFSFPPNDENLEHLRRAAITKLVQQGVLVESPDDSQLILTFQAEIAQQASIRENELAMSRMHQYTTPRAVLQSS